MTRAEALRRRDEIIEGMTRRGAAFAREEALNGTLDRWRDFDLSRLFGVYFENGFRIAERALRGEI